MYYVQDFHATFFKILYNDTVDFCIQHIISEYSDKGPVRNMTLQQLRYIITVAETGTMTEAANALFI